MALLSGTLFADRFVIERLAGSGGMGDVYRAADRLTGSAVALKVLHAAGHSTQDSQRFAREAHLLSELRHPGIVTYVTHGESRDGQRYLAMEWLEGEDLAQRLLRGPLTVRDSVTLLKQVALALAAAHQRGVVHRDLKPTNLFLVGGDVARVKVLDFGIARRFNTVSAVTRTGLVLGTPEYMAPEQARGAQDLQPSADIFSLGCVLYECLCGKPPFTGEHIAAVLVCILFEEPPPLPSRRRGIPAPLVQLLERMLKKAPAERPADAATLAGLMAALDSAPTAELGQAKTVATAATLLTSQEQRLFSVVLARPARADLNAVTVPPAVATAELERRRAIEHSIANLGARVEWLLDGSLVVAVSSPGSAPDQVALAARLALLTKERWPEAAVALATGRGAVQGFLPVGEVVAQATELLEPDPAAHGEGKRLHGVWLDEVSAGLLERRFAVTLQGGRALLSGEELGVDETRPLLGRPTPCVGREQDLTMLGAILTSCIEESEPRVVLITARAGIGKSRLRHEFLRRARSSHRDVTVLVGLGDMMSPGASYGILGQALRRLCGVAGSEPLEMQRQRLTARLGVRAPAAERQQLVELLGEMCGVPFSDADSVKLRAARQDPRIMRDQITAAFLEWVGAESRRSPLLLVLDDLHWGDALTVAMVDSALREHRDKPLMVLALARPEVHELFPQLWQAHPMKELPLGGLSKKACERLIQQVLGKDVPSAVVARLSAQSEGNALYLEELIRAVGEGKGSTLPETMLAMLQARIDRLDGSVRQVLRVASVFGATFWTGGVKALLPAEWSTDNVEAALSRLLASELIERHATSRYQGETEYGFRHVLMREAAYSLVSDDARQHRHRLAGQYLEQRGEPDPMIIAEHFRRASEWRRAIPHYLYAADQAFDGYNLPESVSRAAKGLACNPDEETTGALLSTQASAYLWMGQTELSYQVGNQALPLLKAGSRRWCMVITSLLTSSTALARPVEQFSQLIQLLTTAKPVFEGTPAYAEALSWVIVMMCATGRRAPATVLLEQLQALASAVEENDYNSKYWINYTTSYFANMLGSDPWRTRILFQEGVYLSNLIKYRRMLGNNQCQLGMAEIDLGLREQGEANLRGGLSLLSTLNETLSHTYHSTYLALYLAERCDNSSVGELEQIAQYLQTHAGAAVMCEGGALCARAAILAHQEKWEEAESAARHGLARMRHLPPIQMLPFVHLIRILLKQGRGEAAREAAEEGLQVLQSMGGGGFAEIKMRLAATGVFRATGDDERARKELTETLRQIQLRADRIPDSAQRLHYLHHVPENVRARHYARDWLGRDPFA